MRWRDTGDMVCSVARSLSLVGERWTLLLLREAFAGVRRFEDFQRDLGIARNVLAARLQALVDAGILRRERYQESPERFEYRLTEKGLDLYPVLVSLMRFGDRWLAGPEGPPIVLVHRGCDHVADPRLVCSHCGEALGARDVRPKAGPALVARADAAAPENPARRRAPRRGAR